MVNFGPLAAEIGPVVLGTPANFNGFLVLASLLQRRHSTEANQTLHDVWPSHGLIHYMYIFGGCCFLTEICHVQNSLCIQVLRSPYWYRYCTAPQQWASATKLCDVEHRAPPIFGRTTITSDIGPHSSCVIWAIYWCLCFQIWLSYNSRVVIGLSSLFPLVYLRKFGKSGSSSHTHWRVYALDVMMSHVHFPKTFII